MIIRTVSIITLLAFMLTQAAPSYALHQPSSLAPVRGAEQDAADAYEALDAVEALFAAGSLDSLGGNLG